jgi:molecular chaperone GrpE
MTGVDESGHNPVEWESETEEASGSRPAGSARADEDAADDEIVEGQIVDADDDDDNLSGETMATEIIDGSAPDRNAVTIAMAQRDEYLDSLRRLQAEFENYKKRVAKQQADQMARAALSLVDKLLPVLDTLDLATAHIGDAGSADGRALLAASSQLRDVLAKEGLERIDPVGEEFDPNSHEAVGHLPAEEAAVPGGSGLGGPRAESGAADDAASGEPVVAQVMRPGYRWRGAVVRPAMVMVRG